MTVDQARMRARLASAFDDAGDIETRPIGLVRAALAELDIDPTASIRLAQKLARGSVTGDPAARLLQQIERSATVDAEIAALEEADIDDIKAALPRELADRTSTSEVTPIKPRRRRLSTLGFGGSLIGIAASVLLFIAVRPDRLEQAEVLPPPIEVRPPVAADAEHADAVSEDALPEAEQPARNLLPELSRLQEKASAGRDLYAAEQADLADAPEEVRGAGAVGRALQGLDEKAAQPLAQRRERDLSEERALDPSSDVTVSSTGALRSVPRPAPRPDLSEDEQRELVIAAPSPSPAPPEDPPRPVLRPDVEEGEHVETAAVTSLSAPLPMATADVVRLPEPPPEPAVLLTLLRDLKAVFLVDEARAPLSLRALSNRLPEGRLAAKLGEAELRAAGRKVVALIAFERDGEIVEAALAETPSIQPLPDLSTQTVTGFSGFAEGEPAVLLRSETSFELIDLSASR